MAAATGKASKAQFLDDSATLGGAADATEHRRPHVAYVSPPQAKPNGHPASRDDIVADLKSLDAFGLYTPPRDFVGAAAARPRGSRAEEASGRGRRCESSEKKFGIGVDLEKSFDATTSEQDPFVEMLTRQVRSLQREKAEMGEENAALRREVRSLEDLLESLESLLEGESGDIEKTGGGDGGGGGEPIASASSPEGSRGEVTAAILRRSHLQDQGRDHARGSETGDRSKQRYVGEWLDTAVAFGVTDIAGRSDLGGGEGSYSCDGGGGVDGGVGGVGGGASFEGGNSKMLDRTGARASLGAGHPRRCLAGEG